MNAPALVESQDDPRTPGRTAYRISSLYSPGAVQHAVAELMGGDAVACAQFTRVQRIPAKRGCPQCWGALGYVIVRQPAAIAKAVGDREIVPAGSEGA